ncbi:hypothetical protein GCM10027572_08040 [Flexivirga lutea]
MAVAFAAMPAAFFGAESAEPSRPVAFATTPVALRNAVVTRDLLFDPDFGADFDTELDVAAVFLAGIASSSLAAVRCALRCVG